MAIKPSPSSLTLAALHLVFLAPHAIHADVALQVTWLSPAGGDIYPSGSYLVGQWQADRVVDSPTFRICNIPDELSDSGAGMSDANGIDDGCGAAVRPPVQSGHDGSYQITLLE